LKNVYDVFLERGFIEQVTDEDEVRKALEHPLTCYIGFDPTATSLHIGSLVPIMALVHLQKNGHVPIALVGAGTALIGDPSGKTEMRQVLSRETIDFNAQCLRRQFSRYLDFEDRKALMLNNADWLTKLNYISFLRDIGRHFSVNKMLAAESYKIRLEKGLSFIEFNYMLLQAYDFLYLYQNHDCVMQMGGNDQWGNMLAGVDLIRRIEGKTAQSMTFPLFTTATGQKMGKTEKGTVWLDQEMTSPYDYYQYWINTDDADVRKFLALFTFLPMEEIREAESLSDQELNMAKAILAFEATRITHGEEAAVAAWEASVAAFGEKLLDPALMPSSTIPRGRISRQTTAIPFIRKTRDELARGIPAYEMMYDCGLCSSKSEARRLISQGGGYVNDEPIPQFDTLISTDHLDGNGQIKLRKGKKKYMIVAVEEKN
jgi:tyrosyl-tRNA synthetase